MFKAILFIKLILGVDEAINTGKSFIYYYKHLIFYNKIKEILFLENYLDYKFIILCIFSIIIVIYMVAQTITILIVVEVQLVVHGILLEITVQKRDVGISMIARIVIMQRIQQE